MAANKTSMALGFLPAIRLFLVSLLTKLMNKWNTAATHIKKEKPPKWMRPSRRLTEGGGVH